MNGVPVGDVEPGDTILLGDQQRTVIDNRPFDVHTRWVEFDSGPPLRIDNMERLEVLSTAEEARAVAAERQQ